MVWAGGILGLHPPPFDDGRGCLEEGCVFDDNPFRTLRLAVKCFLGAQDGSPDYLTLDQMAAMVSKSKSTLERLKKRKNNPLPPPAIEGGAGKADEWIWASIRAWLEQEFRRKLPETFPRRPFRR
jgi:hypothetical protein